MKRKENVKSLLISCICLVVIFIGILVVVTIKEYMTYNARIDIVINNIMEVINTKYPSEFDDEIANILNNPNLKLDNNTLAKYGINSNILTNLNNSMRHSLILNIAIIILLVFSLTSIFIIYMYKKDKNIKQITKYIKEINKKNYSLNIEENSEDELSILKNELYKMTVMLKEQSENALKDKKNLMVSLEDISHQLKTPLTAITIMLDNLVDNENMDKDTRIDFINDISKQVNSMNFLVLSLLKLSRFDAGVIVFKKEKIEVNKIIEEVISNLEVLIEIKNINVVIDKEVHCSFLGDYKWELEALTNIVKNAIEHSNSKKNIYIDYSENNFYTKISITDEGTGMEKSDIKNIFKRFYKGKNSSNDSIGIGLALAKNIIENDNGYIKVDSFINKGTTFEIRYMKDKR